MKRYFIWLAMGLWLVSTGFAPGAFEVYSKAVKFAKAGQDHFAFMQYNDLLRNYPMSKYREQALFALGEYYFQMPNLRKAREYFDTYLKEFPDSKERLYALAYLLNIAGQNKNDTVIQELEKQIINLQQVSLIFRDSKEISYRSPLYRKYNTVIHINNIEFYVEGELFAKVSY